MRRAGVDSLVLGGSRASFAHLIWLAWRSVPRISSPPSWRRPHSRSGWSIPTARSASPARPRSRRWGMRAVRNARLRCRGRRVKRVSSELELVRSSRRLDAPCVVRLGARRDGRRARRRRGLHRRRAARERGGAASPARGDPRGAQRRVAGLVAGGAASTDVFAAIAREVGHVIGLPLVAVWRYEPDGTATVTGAWGERSASVPARHPLADRRPDGLRRGPEDRPAREDRGLRAAPRHDRRGGARDRDPRRAPARRSSSTATSGARCRPTRPMTSRCPTTSRIGSPSSPSWSRRRSRTPRAATELARLADEQAALRRVATLVAHGVAAERGLRRRHRGGRHGCCARTARLVRYEPDGTATVVGGVEHARRAFRPSARGGRLEGDERRRAGAARRAGPPGSTTTRRPPARSASSRGELGIRSAVGSPIVVEGRLWGAMIVASQQTEPLPADTEARLARVHRAGRDGDLERPGAVGARRVAGADRGGGRRGAPAGRPRSARRRAAAPRPHGHHAQAGAPRARSTTRTAPALVTEALDHAERATDELRELAHGILPAVLTRGGLRAGVDALASRMPVPVEIDVSVGPAARRGRGDRVLRRRRGAHQRRQARRARAAPRWRRASRTARSRVQVRDDGVGGARPDGSGLARAGGPARRARRAAAGREPGRRRHARRRRHPAPGQYP